jgi:hypothetical protein
LAAVTRAGRQRQSLTIVDYLMLAARLAVIRGIRAGLRRPIARTLALSTTVRD